MSNTTGTFNWYPPLSDLIIAAYARCQIRRSALSPDHLHDAATACNLMQLEWANEQVNLWTVELATTTLIPGRDTYEVDPTTIMIMAAYISEGDPPKDRIITSLDRDTYASFPDKTTPGTPSVYWFQKLMQPTITLWQPPNDIVPRTLHYYRARHLQDATMADGFEAEVPRHFLEAYVAGLAFKLAEIYVPARMDQLAMRAAGAFQRAKERDVENSPLRIVPALATYTSVVY